MAKATKKDPAISALFKAIENRNLSAFQKAWKQVGDITAVRARDGKSLLDYAIFLRADDIALAILERHPLTDPAGANLAWAVLVRRPDVVKQFIALGADLNVRTMMGTPLCIAAAAPRSMRPGSDDDLFEIMHLLIDAGADLNAGSARWSPLKDAVMNNRVGAATLLIEAGANVDDPDELIELANMNENRELARIIREAAKRKPKLKARSKSAEPALDPEIAKLEKLCGTRAFPLDGIDNAVSLHVDSGKKFDLAKVQAEFLKRGKFVFAIDHQQERVAMLPTTDKYKALEAMGTNGANFGLSTEDIIKWMRDLEKEQPFTLTGVGFDFLSGTFKSKVKDPAGLAKRMYEFCSDIVDQGVGTVEELEKQLSKSRDFFFWWD